MSRAWCLVLVALFMFACDDGSSPQEDPPEQMDGGSGAGGGAGAGGEADASGEADTGGEAGVGGGEARDELLEKAQEASIIFSACADVALGEDFIFMVEIFDQAEIASFNPQLEMFLESVDCLLNSSNCEEVQSCKPSAYTDTPCDHDEFETYCDGNKRIRCDNFMSNDHFLVEIDCSNDPSGNYACHSLDGWSFCGTETICDELDEERCDGDIVINCNEGFEIKQDCSLAGQRCAILEDGDAVCVFNDESPCSACDGDVASSCVEGMTRAQFDCRLIGLACVPKENSWNEDTDGTCEASMRECEDSEVRCEGDSALLCAQGAWFEFDCGRFGARCALEEGEASCALP